QNRRMICRLEIGDTADWKSALRGVVVQATDFCVNFTSLYAIHCSKHVRALVRPVIRHSLALYILVVVSISLAGCARYQPAPLSPNQTAAALESRSLTNTGLREFVEEFRESEVMVVPRIAKTNWPAAKW